jgi:peptidoglycan/LPS O-acetylase OafA/YrhL
LNPMHSLFHLDCIAFGSLIALGIMACNWRRCVWLYVGIASAILGFGALYFASGTPLQDSAIGLGLTGIVLIALVASSRPNPFTAVLRHGPLPFFGTISYGLYLCHMPVIMSLGPFYTYVDHATGGHLWWANLIVVTVQLAISTAIATLLWFFLERRILQLKRHFQS